MTAEQIRNSTDGKVNGVTIPHFHDNVADITAEMYGGSFKAGDLAAPSAATVLDKDLKMPTTWKASLAADFSLPGGWKASLEGIYNKDLNAVVVNSLGKNISTVQLPGEPKARTKSSAIAGVNTAYLVTNKNVAKTGHYASVTASIRKSFAWGLDLMAAYTYSDARSVTEGDGDQITSGFTETTYCVDGSNANELGYAAFVSPHRVIGSANYRFEYAGGHLATNIGLFYEGYNYGYANKYSASRFSYTMNNQTGEGGAPNLIYIPTTAELQSMPFADASNKAAYEKFISGDKYLSKHRGEYSKRGGPVMPWYGQIALRVSEDFMFNALGRKHTLRLGVDVNNLANLLNPKWGNVQRIESPTILTYKGGVYTFNESQSSFNNYASYLSTWSMLLSVRYFF